MNNFEDILYIIEYRYTVTSSMRYKTFKNIDDAYDYFDFLERNLSLNHLALKKCSIACEVFVCGR